MMMTKPLIALCLSAATVSAFAGAKCEKHPADQQIPAEKFQQQLKEQGYTIKKFKAEDNCYEIYGTNKEGQKVEIYFDTKTGQPVKTEVKN